MASPELLTDQRARLEASLRQHDQAHLLRFFDELDPLGQRMLLGEVESIDLNVLAPLIERLVLHPEPESVPGSMEPPTCYPAEACGTEGAAEFRAGGEALIRAGKVAAFAVAGGQGTRLGWRGPKGSFPATPVTGKPLFQVFAEQILRAESRYHVTIPWLIMTSLDNDADTRAFFLDNNCFGLMRPNITMFPQRQMPSMDRVTGRILLSEKSRVAMNPDGHGGSLRALHESGALEELEARGIEHICYFQIDNPLVKVVDPLFIGLHASAPNSSAEMSSKMVSKAGPDEKVGVFARVDGRTRVIEYSDLPVERAGERDASGELRFNAGSIAIHMLSVRFVQSLMQDGAFALPWHRAEKRVPYVDVETGQRVVPDEDEKNAVKLETFVFDALPRAESSIILQTPREEEFAPIKNARGADSVGTSQQMQSDRAARWLEMHGVSVPWDDDGHVQARIEISPLTAGEPADLVAVDLPKAVEPGGELLL